MTQMMPQPDHEPGAELPTHTVGVFITYRRDEPIKSQAWAEQIGRAIRHAPFVINAVTAAAMDQLGVDKVRLAQQLVQEFTREDARAMRVAFLAAWPQLHEIMEALAHREIKDVVDSQLTRNTDSGVAPS